MGRVGEIQRVLLVGDLAVYHRMWSEPGLKKYVIYHVSRDRFFQEFERKETAYRWAISHNDHADEMLSIAQHKGA